MSDATLHIVRTLQDNFTMIANEFARNPEVTPRAARLFIYLASHSTGWKLSITATMNATGMGRGQVFSALNDLRRLGYVTRRQVVDEDDRFAGMEYQIFESPLPVEARDDVSARTSPRIPKSGTRNELGKQGESAGEARVPESGIRESRIRESDTLKKTNTKENQPKEHQGEEKPQAELAIPTPKKQTRATTLPEGWVPDKRVIDQMRAEHPNIDLRAEHMKFTDYFNSVAGQRGRKRDWNAAWRNWIRKAAEYAPQVQEDALDVARRMAAREQAEPTIFDNGQKGIEW